MYNKPSFGVHTACVYHAADGGIRKLFILSFILTNLQYHVFNDLKRRSLPYFLFVTRGDMLEFK